ncbi:2-C-methyl-D-erythritol 4-phosphate cytidylyltransferase [Sediminibacterium sp. KACHI17]|jgi:2-C-methyl-D-erythritol 4-phosphate cytidylyltransferase|uniref:2-C-methyl-D-erythritol 4-phosphate cytidylyltransferase n=2 Tax=Sediminibacterium sp. KACHI17 TaxID=1751071 RepID=A0AAT9GFR7_9BACT
MRKRGATFVAPLFLTKNAMQKIAVIVAGGIGQRMGASIPKQFLLLNGKPILWHTLQRFLMTWDDLRIILVLPAEHQEEGNKIVQTLQASDRVTITTGGDTRFQSVKNGLSLIKEPAVIFVHDGVRCLLSSELIKRCFQQTLEKGSAIPAVAATDSIRIVEGEGHYVADRNLVRIIQTPQTFLSDLLLPAFQQSYQTSFTDEATVVEAAGKKVFLIEGEYTNIKITRPEDLQMAEQMIQR